MKTPPRLARVVLGLDAWTRDHVAAAGGVALLAWDTLRGMFSPRQDFAAWMRQFEEIGVRSFTITNITSLFMGMVLALQTGYSLARFGAKYFIGDVVALSLVRELGPVMAALMVGGRVGSGIAAELGSMQVTEQVDAMRALGADPVRKLVVPRVLATTLMLPLLTILADFIGIMGGLGIAVFELQIPYSFYMGHVIDVLEFGDIFSGIGKAVFFGFTIGIIACYNGLSAQGGAGGVGVATKNTVVATSITILIMDFFLTKFFMLF